MAKQRLYSARFYLLVTERRGRALVELVTGETARLLRALVWSQYQPSKSDRWIDVEPGDFDHTIDGERALLWLRNPDNQYRRLIASTPPRCLRAKPLRFPMVEQLH